MSYDTNSVSLDDLPEIAAGLKQATDEVKKQHAKNDARLRELEQKLVRGDDPSIYDDGDPVETVGQRFAATEGLRQLSADRRGRVRMECKTVSRLLPQPSAGGVIRPVSRVRLTLRDVLGKGRMGAGSFEYLREGSHTGNAAPQVEGQLKAQINAVTTVETASARTIAAWVRVTQQMLADHAALAPVVDGLLRRKLQHAEELQILSGDGTAPNLEGILPLATAFSAPFEITTPTMLDVLLQAIAQHEGIDGNVSTFIAMNPTDFREMESLKDTTGRYLIGSPFESDDFERLWSLPVVPTQAMQAGEFLIGDEAAAVVYDRQDAAVEASTEDGDNFTTNRVTLRAEERLALAILKPSGFVLGDFPA